MQEDLRESRQEAEKAQKQADKYQKRMNELAPMVKNMEKLAADFSTDPEQTLPEAAVMEAAKSHREKKANPLVKKIVQVMRSVYSVYLDISNKFTKAVIGSEQVNAVIDRARQQEQIEAEQKRAARRKHKSGSPLAGGGLLNALLAVIKRIPAS